MAPTAGTRLRFKKQTAKKPFKQTKKVPSLKNRIRALERFLNRGGNIDDRTRAVKTEELKQLKAEQDGKERLEDEKKNAEKYKKPRFFERVKLMRKLKQAQSALDDATDKKEKRTCEKELEQVRHDLIYVYYYPKTEQFLSLFPTKPHSDEATKRQEELRAAALARFEEEQPLDAFHKFCHADGNGAATASSSSAAALLVKKPTKEEEKKKKKLRSKKDKTGESGDQKSKKSKTTSSRVVADEDEEMANASDAEGGKADKKDDEDEEEDDFFL